MVTQRANHGIRQFDRRGKHVKKVIPESQKESVRLHIASIPSEQSHYTRNRTTRKFLSCDLNLAELYRMYTKECKSKDVPPVKEWLYRDIFANEFNLSFKPNRMDTCKKCDVLNNKILFEENMEAKRVMETEKDIHLRKADLARKSLQKDEAYSKQIFTESDNENEDIIQLAADFKDTEVITFDLQKVFSVPRLSTNEVYYCRQLSVYNLGLHNMTKTAIVMNVWHEAEASRGPEEIASCLLEIVAISPTKE